MYTLSSPSSSTSPPLDTSLTNLKTGITFKSSSAPLQVVQIPNAPVLTQPPPCQPYQPSPLQQPVGQMNTQAPPPTYFYLPQQAAPYPHPPSVYYPQYNSPAFYQSSVPFATPSSALSSPSPSPSATLLHPSSSIYPVAPKQEDLKEDLLDEKENSQSIKKKKKGSSKDDSTDTTTKGREASRQFRERQRVRVEELENQIAQLLIEQKMMQDHVERVTQENILIRAHQTYLRKIITQALMAAYPEPPKDMLLQRNTKTEKVSA